MKKPIARVFAALLAVLLLCGVLPLMVNAAGPVDITDKFTDPAFRAAVQELIGKEVILDTDVAGITELQTPGGLMIPGSIKSLAGLEYFTSLKSLVCISNPITALPTLPASIEKLWFWDTHLSVLSALPSGLKELICLHNQLTSLPALPSNLEHLNCSENQLASLPALPSTLTVLYCASNRLASIDVTGLSLKLFDCRYNDMTSASDVIGFIGIWNSEDYHFYPQNSTTTPIPTYFWSDWSPTMQFILKYILFGWLWMRLF